MAVLQKLVEKWVALYVRLSRDDENEGDSNSIAHQIEILTKYARDHGITNYKIYKDDGYSGTSFKRPGFQEMLGDIEAGLVGMVVVKDMSRFGRNYLEVGLYTEIRFPEMGVRFIAVNDGVDSEDQSSNDFTPFRNIINERYARDISLLSSANLSYFNVKNLAKIIFCYFDIINLISEHKYDMLDTKRKGDNCAEATSQKA